LGIPPWYYFQINAEWYNKKKGFYSKIDMDARIPKKWRLKQDYFDKNNLPETFPVFLKPEWGQNSNGIIKINNKQEFLNFDQTNGKIPYILQYAAHEEKEYEIFYIRDAANKKCLSTLNITQSLNRSDERYPVNGIPLLSSK
jgi:carbamoylphosphate synthase large subunit